MRTHEKEGLGVLYQKEKANGQPSLQIREVFPLHKERGEKRSFPPICKAMQAHAARGMSLRSLHPASEVSAILGLNRDWQTEKNKDFAKWCSTHRHHGIDIVLLTQHIDRVDAAVRAMVEWTYKYRKMNMFGQLIGDKSYMCLAYAGDDTTGYPMTKQTKTYDPKIFRCYKSYVSKDIKELKIAKSINIFKKPVFLMIPIVIGIFIYTFSHSSLATGDLFGSKKAAKMKKTICRFLGYSERG